jgi:hypothetical protein
LSGDGRTLGSVKDNPVYTQLLEQMRAGTDTQLLADLTRFVDSFADHDDDCPGYAVVGREAELAACTCGFARRYDLLDEVRLRLTANSVGSQPDCR